MLTALTILAQRGTQEPPEEGTSILLIIGAVLFVILVAVAIMTAFRTYSKKTRETGPDKEPHEPGHAGRAGD